MLPAVSKISIHRISHGAPLYAWFPRDPANGRPFCALLSAPLSTWPSEVALVSSGTVAVGDIAGYLGVELCKSVFTLSLPRLLLQRCGAGESVVLSLKFRRVPGRGDASAHVTAFLSGFMPVESLSFSFIRQVTIIQPACNVAVIIMAFSR